MCKKCEVCEERPVSEEAVANGQNWCDECSKGGFCDQCDTPINDDTLRQWQPALCERCAARNERQDAVDALESAVKALAAEHEWTVALDSIAQTGSRYYTLSRECDNCILGDDGDCTCETLKVRISDHGTAYCSEDISLVAGDAGGDDHNLTILAKRLAR